MKSNQNTAKAAAKTKAEYDPPHIFDLTFKKLFHLSRRAVINLINGCFDRDYPLDSTLEYLATENVTDDLGHTFCDISILIAGSDGYILEAQAGNDSSIAIRIFEYGYRSGLKRKTVGEDHIIEIPLPYVMAIYWLPRNQVPEKETLRLVGPDGRFFDYEIKSFNFLEHSIKELEEKKMSVLLPFYVLKRCEAAKTAATERSREMAQYLIGKKWDIREIVEATKLDMDTVQSLFAQG